MEQYDPSSDTWTTKADLPTLRSHLMTQDVGGKICPIGGTPFVGTGNWHTLRTVEFYDPETDTWTQEVDMPTARGWFSANLVDGKLNVIGGGPGSGLQYSLPMELGTVEEFVTLSPE